MRVDAGWTEGLASGSSASQEVIEEIVQRRECPAFGKSESAESILRNHIRLNLAPYVSTETNRVTSACPGHGILKLVELFVGTLWQVLGDAERVRTAKALPAEGDVVVLRQRVSERLRGGLKEEIDAGF